MGGDSVGPSAEHLLGVGGGGDAGGLEVFHHGPRAPAAHHFGKEGVHSCADKSHTASIPEGPCGDIFRADAQGSTNGGGGEAELGGDVLGCDSEGLPRGQIVSVEGCSWRSSVLTEHQHLSEDSFERGQGGIRGVAMNDGLTFRAVLLGGEIEEHGGGPPELGNRSCGSVDGSLGSLKGDVL